MGPPLYSKWILNVRRDCCSGSVIFFLKKASTGLWKKVNSDEELRNSNFKFKETTCREQVIQFLRLSVSILKLFISWTYIHGNKDKYSIFFVRLRYSWLTNRGIIPTHTKVILTVKIYQYQFFMDFFSQDEVLTCEIWWREVYAYNNRC